MAINVAGTNALGDYLVSEIQNTRILMGESPGYTTTPAPTTTGSAPPTASQLQQELSASALANAQTLFGISQSTSSLSAPSALPTIPGQTAQQITAAGIQSSLINDQFTNIATLFNSPGSGTNIDQSA